jgi:hypothetical protein
MSGVRKPIEDLDDIFIKISEKFSNKIEILKKKKPTGNITASKKQGKKHHQQMNLRRKNIRS